MSPPTSSPEVVLECFHGITDRYLLPLYKAAGGPPIEVLVYDPSELSAMSERPFIRRILEESIVVYRRQESEALTGAGPPGGIAE